MSDQYPNNQPFIGNQQYHLSQLQQQYHQSTPPINYFNPSEQQTPPSNRPRTLDIPDSVSGDEALFHPTISPRAELSMSQQETPDFRYIPPLLLASSAQFAPPMELSTHLAPDSTVIPPLRFHFGPFDPILHHSVSQTSTLRLELLLFARQAETVERFADMAVITRHIAVITEGKLSREERTLFFIAHQRILLPLRAAIKQLNQHYHSPEALALARDYRKYVEYELKTLCRTLIEFVLAILLKPSLSLPDHRVFFLKFVGDLYRYLAELNPIPQPSIISLNTKNSDNPSISQDLSAKKPFPPQEIQIHGPSILCRKYYHEAAVLAEKHLSITSPVRLGLLLNYCVAAFDLFRDYKTACEMIKSAFDKAITRLNELDEEDYRDSTLLLQLMRDNLALWVTIQNNAQMPTLTFPSSFDIDQLPSHPHTIAKKELIRQHQQQITPPLQQSYHSYGH